MRPATAVAPPARPAACGLRIPRVFHRVWLGADPMPAEYEAFGRTWLERHPGWEMVTWTDETLPPLRNRALFEATATAAGRADIARYEILLAHGGVYVDTDFECLRNLEPLLQGVQAFAASEDGRYVSIGIIGAVPGHPVLARAVSELAGHAARRAGRPANEVTGPHFFTAVAAGSPELVVFDRALFYPYHMTEPWRRGEAFPDAYAVHHWAYTWRPAPPPVPAVRRVAAALDLADPGAGSVVLATYFSLFAAADPVELALVVPGGFAGGNRERLLELVGGLAPVSEVPEVVAFEPGEPGAPEVPFARGVLHAASCARAVAELHLLRRVLDAGAAAA